MKNKFAIPLSAGFFLVGVTLMWATTEFIFRVLMNFSNDAMHVVAAFSGLPAGVATVIFYNWLRDSFGVNK